MKKFNEEIKMLTAMFITNADVNIKIKQEKFLVNNFEFYGILTSKRKPLVKSLLNNWNKTLSLASKKQLFTALYYQKNREFQYTAMEFLNLWWKKNLSFNDLDWLLLIIKHNIWWDTTDYFDNIIGVLIFSNPNINVRNQYLFTLIIPLLLTTNFYLMRAIGWALRNAKRINQRKVNEFIKINNVSKQIIAVINEH